MSLKYADIHIHLTLKPFLNTTTGNYSNIWKYTKTSYWAWTGKARTNVQNLIDGKVKIIFPALGYIEKGWQITNSLKFKLPAIFRNTGDLLIFFINVNIANITNYYQLLKQEIDFLLKQAKPPIDIPAKYQKYQITFPQTKTEFIKLLTDPTKIIAIPTIEGANSLISGTVTYQTPNLNINQIIQNINELKTLPLKPLFITFSHHFYNGLAGHAKSIYKFPKLINQNFGLGNPISPDGWKIIKCLLGLNQQCIPKPIFIDTKHFSIAARRQYFDFIKQNNYSFPVINSHAGYSGNITIEQIIYSNPLYSNNQTNISGEEVYHIWRSKGLIGINFDQSILAPNYPNPKSDTQLIIHNITGMINGAIKFAKLNKLPLPDQSIWDIFCIGSDFDGFINPIDSYTSPLQFEQLEQNLYSELQKIYNQLPIKLNPTEITQKFMYQNVIQFLKKWLE